jgi:dTDP-4-amino-4,6-dideoxygalactose transaminase
MKKVKETKLRVPYGFSVHGQEEIDAVVEVLKGNTALGDKTTEFEAKVLKNNDFFGVEDFSTLTTFYQNIFSAVCILKCKEEF